MKLDRAAKALGCTSVAALAITVWMALVVSPADVNQKDAVRLLYLHVPTAWIAMYLSFGATTLASLLWLWRRTRSPKWDLLAGASAETGVVFIGLTLVIGSIWGRTTWGVWWTWDARLTTTAVLFVLYLGYLAIRRVPAAPEVRAKRAAIVALAAFVDVPIVHQSVEWWRTLHQPASLLDQERLLHPAIHGSMLATLLIALGAFTILYAWLLIRRYQVAAAEQQIEDRGVEEAIAERLAEAKRERDRVGAGAGGAPAGRPEAGLTVPS
jgi:heme exporter protein C